jgi:hypothetical protein
MIEGPPERMAYARSSGEYLASRDRMLLSCGLAAALLFWAAFSAAPSHGFFTFLRIYICGLSLFLAFAFRTVNRPAWALVALCSAILFNPVLPVDFRRDDWMVLDFAAGALFGWLALQPYARARGRKWAPYAPAGAALILAVTQIEPRPAIDGGETMNVDILSIDNLIVNDTTLDEPSAGTTPEDEVRKSDPGLGTAASTDDHALERAAEAILNAANAVEQSDPSYARDPLPPDNSASADGEDQSANPFDDLVPQSDGSGSDGAGGKAE